MSGVWILAITHFENDYKRRNGDDHTLKVFDTKKGAEGELYNFLVNYIREKGINKETAEHIGTKYFKITKREEDEDEDQIEEGDNSCNDLPTSNEERHENDCYDVQLIDSLPLSDLEDIVIEYFNDGDYSPRIIDWDINYYVVNKK